MNRKSNLQTVKLPLLKNHHARILLKKMYYTYILTNNKKTVLYTGVTNNLIRRITQHYSYKGSNQTFCGKYHCYNLILYEEFHYIKDAIAREKAIKKWPRAWKENLINRVNPEWIFLNDTLFDRWPPMLLPDLFQRSPGQAGG